MNVQHIEKIERVLNDYNISRDDICIVGSSVLAIYGIRQNNDLDFAIHPQVRDKVIKKVGSSLIILPSGTMCISESLQSPKDRYKKLDILDDELFKNYSIRYGEFRYAVLEVEIAMKIVRFRDKDVADLKRICFSNMKNKVVWPKVTRLLQDGGIQRLVELSMDKNIMEND